MSDTEKIDEVSKADAETSPKSKQKQKPKTTQQKGTVEESSDGNTDQVEVEEDEALKIMNTVLSMGTKVVKLFLCFLKCVLGLIRGAASVVRSALGSILGLGLFMTFAYVMRHYVIEEVTEEDVPDFESRLKFLLRCEIWPVFPVFLAGTVGFMSKNDVHAKYSRERFEQALLFLLNLLLVSTHIETECLIWVRSFALVNAAFSMLLWFCLVYTKKCGNLFARPLLLFNFLVMACNVYVILGQEVGLVTLLTEPSVTSVPTQTENNSGWF